MISPKKFAIAAAFALATAIPAQAQDVTADTVVATVGGTDITVGHMIVARTTLPEQYKQLPDDVLFTGILDQLVQQTAISQTMTGELDREAQINLANQRSAFLAGQVLSGIAEAASTDEAIQEAYDAAYGGENAGTELEFNAAHILVETEEEAVAIKAELDGGADFAELAKEKSTGPSGPNGGSLGWFGKGMMVKPFEDAVVGMEPGQISEPVQTQFGWHVLILNETRPLAVPTLAEKRDEIAADIQSAAVQARIDEILETTEVVKPEAEIDPSVLKKLDLLKN
ncbi:peptidylprolyl isomerase [Alphaproteobacteria bacterium KMM 3653]|uniref:Parvulin-like PPIase n=1 Tax=Harenicola maris TaxID=2841044 RepID=A0AAP2CSB3_9RHOB|nr:peptidylprolyl isomerase [Harenicola maris]